MSTPTGSYPRAGEVDVALRDGSTLHIRPVRRSDKAAVATFLEGLSPESIAFRFVGSVDLEWVADWSTDVDYSDRYALVATSGAEQTTVAHGAYVRTGSDRAEVAFTVADAWQGHGIATIMLAHLATAAEDRGITVFTAAVLPSNHRMIQVFRDSGFPVAQRAGDGVIEIELPTSRFEQTRERFEQREQTAATAAVELFLRPRSVAVVGASRRRGTVGGELLYNLISGGYAGSVYPINPGAETIEGLRAYPSIRDVPERVDLAVIAVSAERVCAVARECGHAGVRGLLVISAGFAEQGEEGMVRQQELLAACRECGMRLVGPNCLGVLNTALEVRLNATFVAHAPLGGRIGFLSQSGGLGIAIIEAASRLGLGLSSFVSIGNRLDVSGNDVLAYWEHDPATSVVLLYLESFGNPRRFARLAPRVGRVKPIAAVKSGRSPAGARATSSHTGALLATSDVTVDALFKQAGVIRTDTMHELFDVGALLSRQPVPAGRRVAIVTNAGGPGILCADACQDAGLDVAELSGKLRTRLREFLAPEAAVGNPIDMIATAPAENYRRTIETLSQESACDAIIAIFVPPIVTPTDEVGQEIKAAAATAPGVTLATVFMNSEGPPRGDEGTGLPNFDFPEDAARALGRAAAYANWRARPRGRMASLAGCRADEAAAVVTRNLATGGGWIGPLEVAALFDCYGLPLVQARLAHNGTAAAAAGREVGFPVALKAVSPGLLHKSDAGGVRLGLDTREAVLLAAREITGAVQDGGGQLDGFLVQPMVDPGVELLMGVVHDESFGPVIACGAGGTLTEVLADVAVRITPLTDLDAREMLGSLRTFRLLEGFRGVDACDIAAVEDVLLRLSALVEAHPEVAELDANPVVAGPGGAVIVDARVRLAPVPTRHPLPSL
jgi:acetyl coenzyme A synthetase (ADP forming)-like protein